MNLDFQRMHKNQIVTPVTPCAKTGVTLNSLEILFVTSVTSATAANHIQRKIAVTQLKFSIGEDILHNYAHKHAENNGEQHDQR